MKILIIQLTRPGDIFCTWPTLSAIRRARPDAEIHFLVRKKFFQAAKDFTVVNHFWTFDSEKWLSPLIEDPLKTSEALNELGSFVSILKSEKYDEIINLSFSPSSSFLTHLISHEETVVRGYTRSQDFYLFIPDEASRYFRAQVGLGKSNKLHVVDLFSMVAGVSLDDIDMTFLPQRNPRSYVVCHVGASIEQKSWPLNHWKILIEKILKAGYKVKVVGGAEDFKKARYIENDLACENLQDLVGQTDFSELSKILSYCKVFIGADSGPLHVANRTECLSLNLSLGPVKFWETGPTVKGSQVLVCREPEKLKPEEVYLTLLSILQRGSINSNARLCDGLKPIRYDDRGLDSNISWSVTAWLYFGAEKPECSEETGKLINQIIEVCDMATAQIQMYKKNPENTKGLRVLLQIDEVLKIISQTDVFLSPVLQNFFVEKENILPGTSAEVSQATLRCYEWLRGKSLDLSNPSRVERKEELSYDG